MPAASPRRRFPGLPGPVSKPIAAKLPNGDELPAISMGGGAGFRHSERVEKPFSPGESGLVHYAGATPVPGFARRALSKAPRRQDPTVAIRVGSKPTGDTLPLAIPPMTPLVAKTSKKMTRLAWRKASLGQSGFTLLALAALLGFAVTLFVLGLTGNLARSNTADQQTAQALAQAKQALIGYAATYRDRNADKVFGYLPCPDMSTAGTEGSAETSASDCIKKDVTVIGRLPWRTLDLEPLRDGDGECLWYAVSGNFKANLNKTDLMNWDTNGLIEIMAPDGTNFIAGGSGSSADPTIRAAAVIFAPGAILPGQDRAPPGTSTPQICGGNYDPAAYLDADAASTINNATVPPATPPHVLTRFIAALNSDNTASTSDTFNDRVAFITPQEIFAAHLEKRADFLPYLHDPIAGMLKRAADCIAAYGNNNLVASDRRLPWAAPLTYANYGSNSSYNDASGLISGRLPYIANTSDAATNNNLVTGSGVLLDPSVCPNWTERDEFWLNFKDHVFYAVADAFSPDSLVASDPDPCLTEECLTVEGTPGMAAVLIFAGKKQTGQSRNTETDYSSPQKSFWSTTTTPYSNFLEGSNALSMQDNSADFASPRTFTKYSGNDTVMCIRKDSVSGTMFVDPACGTSSACSIDGSALDAYRSGAINTCKIGKKDVLPACEILVDTINDNNCSCEKAAKKFIKKPCLDDLGHSKCVSVITDLQACS